ncbi:MAG: sugar transferase [Parcubacteria group bacterium]|nr:sugar transferase [Parcubacteria group bacterium]
MVLLYAALFFTVYLRYGGISASTSANYTTWQLFLVHVRAFTPLIFVWLVIFYIHNLYEITSAKNTLEFYSGLARALAVNFLAAVLFFYFAALVEVAPKRNLFIYFAIFAILFVLWRSQINSLLKRKFLVRTAIIAGDESAVHLALKLNQNPQIGYRVDFVVGTAIPGSDTDAGFKLLSSHSKVDAADLINTQGVRALIIDDRFLQRESLVTSLYDFVDNVEVTTLDKFSERVWRKVDLAKINQLWFLNNFASGRRAFYDISKRAFDFLISLVLLPFAFVVGIFIAGLIRLAGQGSVFYKQVRLGRKGRLFTLVKFRTMILNAEAGGVQWTAQNDKRITRIGRFLRKIRLDELPQLWNILRGEMSFVGPRAERPEFHQFLLEQIPFYDQRYLVKPGLTGWAQINYTYGSSVEDTKEKLAYDFYYLKYRSLVFDIGIILKTINIVLSALGR